MTAEKPRYKLKVVLVGDSFVGKTALIGRFVEDRFNENSKPTCVFCYQKVVDEKDYEIIYEIWDTAGQERFKSLVPMYLRNAHIAFVVYDVSNALSFKHLDVWLEVLRKNGDVPHTVIVGNKIDLNKTVDDKGASLLADQHGFPFACVSAKTGENVESLFIENGKIAVEKIKSQTAVDWLSTESVRRQTVHLNSKTGTRKRKCCR